MQLILQRSFHDGIPDAAQMKKKPKCFKAEKSGGLLAPTYSWKALLGPLDFVPRPSWVSNEHLMRTNIQ